MSDVQWRDLLDLALNELRNTPGIQLLLPGECGNCFGSLPRVCVGPPSTADTLREAHRRRPELMALRGISEFYSEIGWLYLEWQFTDEAESRFNAMLRSSDTLGLYNTTIAGAGNALVIPPLFVDETVTVQECGSVHGLCDEWMGEVDFADLDESQFVVIDRYCPEQAAVLAQASENRWSVHHGLVGQSAQDLGVDFQDYLLAALETRWYGSWRSLLQGVVRSHLRHEMQFVGNNILRSLQSTRWVK